MTKTTELITKNIRNSLVHHRFEQPNVVRLFCFTYIRVSLSLQQKHGEALLHVAQLLPTLNQMISRSKKVLFRANVRSVRVYASP